MACPVFGRVMAAVAYTKEDARAAAWERGILSWKLRPEQKELHDILERAGRELIVPNIARKIGKTTTCSTFAIEQAIRKKQHIRYATAFLSDLTEFLLPIIDLLLADCPDRVRPVYHQSRKTYTFPNGSVIKLVGLDKNRNGLRGNIIDILIIDEAAFVANLEYLYRSVIIPATKNRPFKLIFPSTPPESPEHFWAAELVPKAQDRGTYLEMTLDADKSLDPRERKRLLDEVGGEDSPTAQREYFCRIIIDATRAVCASFKEEKHTNNSYDPEHVKWALFADTGGVRDKTVFLEVGFDLATRLVIFRSELIFDRGTPTTAIVEAVKEKWPEHTSLIMDAPGQLLIDYSAAGLPAVLPQKDDFGAGLLLLLTTFHNDQAVIDPGCELLIRTLKGGLLNKRRTDYERTEALGHCDAAATCIYALRGVDRVTDLRPRPKREDVFTLPQDPPHLQAIKGLAYARR